MYSDHLVVLHCLSSSGIQKREADVHDPKPLAGVPGAAVLDGTGSNNVSSDSMAQSDVDRVVVIWRAMGLNLQDKLNQVQRQARA